MGKGKLIDEIFGEITEPHMIQPTFITDYLVEMSPLCKKHRDNPELTERFELMVNGKELCNAYIELNELKAQARLSNKKWDKAVKGLTKIKLAKVEKTNAGLLVSLG